MLVRCFRYQLEISIDISRSDRWSCKLLKPTLLGWFFSVLDDFSKKYQVDNNPYLMTLMLLQSCTAYSHSHFHFKKEASTQSIPKPGLVSNTMSFESFDVIISAKYEGLFVPLPRTTPKLSRFKQAPKEEFMRLRINGESLNL